jgi:hypothetical protein
MRDNGARLSKRGDLSVCAQKAFVICVKEEREENLVYSSGDKRTGPNR